MLKQLVNIGKPAVVSSVFIIATIFIIAAILLPKSKLFSSRDGNNFSKVSGLVCDENVHDFGSITAKEATKREYTFVLINTSKHPINILKQGSTCGCTVVELPEGTIVPAGGTLEVPVKADWAGRAGAQSAIVNILTDDPKTPTISLTVRGVVKVSVVVTPSVINFGLLKPGQQATRIVELHPGTDPKPFRLTGIKVLSENLLISRLPDKPGEVPPPLLEESTGGFAVTVTAPRVGGREQTRIVFKTDLAERPEVWLDVTAQFQDVFVATPKSVLFSGSGDTGIPSRKVQICSVDKDVHFDPKVQLIWEANEINPFSVEKITNLSKTDDSLIILAIKFDKNKAKQMLNRAILRVSHENDCLDVPIMAIGQSRKMD